MSKGSSSCLSLLTEVLKVTHAQIVNLGASRTDLFYERKSASRSSGFTSFSVLTD